MGLAIRLVGAGRGAVVEQLDGAGMQVSYIVYRRYIPTVMSVDPDVVPSELMLAWQV